MHDEYVDEVQMVEAMLEPLRGALPWRLILRRWQAHATAAAQSPDQTAACLDALRQVGAICAEAREALEDRLGSVMALQADLAELRRRLAATLIELDDERDAETPQTRLWADIAVSLPPPIVSVESPLDELDEKEERP